MMSIQIGVILLASCAGVAARSYFLGELEGEWNLFVKTFNKSYDTEQSLRRRAIWENNLQYIRIHNYDADMGLHSYRLGMNEYGDMTNEEFRQSFNGFKRKNNTRSGSTFLPPQNVELKNLPNTVDWRQKGYVTEVKNQGQCGSCWAFSTTGSVEGQHFRQTGTLTSLSEQNLVDCSVKEGNHGCNGGYMDYGFQYIIDNRGIDTEKSYRYKAEDEPKCYFKRKYVGAKIRGFTDVTEGSEDDLKTAVGTVGPVSVAIDASHQSFQFYASGIYDEPDCSSDELDHGVLAVGYGTDVSDYWLVKNSWGTSWGEKGYIRMSRNLNNQCGIATMASYPTV